MALDRFASPLYARGSHVVQQISGLDDAFDLLEEWPPNDRNMAYRLILDIVHEAACGRRPISSARENLEHFLALAGKLATAEDAPAYLPMSPDRSVGSP
jgi:hypothetical protein